MTTPEHPSHPTPALADALDETPGLLDPQRQLLGAVMHLPTPTPTDLLTQLRAEDFTDPTARWVFGLACTATTAGLTPNPVVLFDTAREHLDSNPRTGPATRLARLGLWLVDTYRDAPTLGPDHAHWLAATVIKASWRRAITTHATRMLQAAEQCGTAELRRITADTTHLDDTWRRYQQITTHITARITDTAATTGLEIAA